MFYYPKTKTEARLSSLIPTHDQQKLPGTENSIRPNPEIMQYPAGTSGRPDENRDGEGERERNGPLNTLTMRTKFDFPFNNFVSVVRTNG